MDYVRATSLVAQTTLRSILGQSELDELLSKREQLNQQLQKIIDEATEPWGVKVSIVEVRDVALPPEMIRAMSRQAEAERERRAKIIHAEGEYQAAQKLADAGKIMAATPTTLQLRYLQTLTEISTEHSSTVVFPVPIDILGQLMRGVGGGDGGGQGGGRSQVPVEKEEKKD
jgi:regulator of protease activity HflC (stomatin/prohibitin superfamily)